MSLASTDWSDADWRTQAACRNIEPDLFFPLGRTREALVHIEEAKAVCRGCPVHAECLEFALANNLEDGVWGGTSEDERRRLRPAWLAGRRRSKVAHG